MAISCTKESQESFVEVTLDYSVRTEAYTKAFGEGEAVTHVWYALYKENGTFVCSFTPAEIRDGVADCPVRVVIDQPYKIVFVGMNCNQTSEGIIPAYEVDNEDALLIMPTVSLANSEKLDCFYGIDDLLVGVRGTTAEITLDRITSQVNFLCTPDSPNADYVSVASSTSRMTLYGVAASFNLLEGTFSEEVVDVTYEESALLAGSDIMHGEKYRLCSVYTFAGEDVSVEFSLNVEGVDQPVISASTAHLPLAPNKRTNIIVNN